MSYQRTNRNSNNSNNMKSSSNRGRNSGGRSNRGRRRYQNRRNNGKYNKTFVKKEPEIKCRTKEEMKHDQEQKILKMQYYYEDNNLKPKLPTLQLNKKNTYLDKQISKLKNQVINDGWELHNETDENNSYFTHPYSNLQFPVIYKKYYHDVEITKNDGKKTIVKELYEKVALPKFIEEADINNNSLIKKPTHSNELPWFFSEITYKTELLDNVLKHDILKYTYNDFWTTRRGKRTEKYNIYMQKRQEKKKLFQNI